MYLRYRILFLFGSFFFLSSTIFAQENETPLSLADAVETGLQNHLQIQIAEANNAIARTNNSWEAAGRYPTVSLIVTGPNSYSDQVNPANVVLPESTTLSTGVNATLDATWVLFDGFKVRITKEQLDLLEIQSQGNANLVVENVIQQIIQSYYLALISKEQLNVVQEVLNLSVDQVAYQKVRQEFGQGSTFDMLQSNGALLGDSSNYLIQLENYQNALRSLNRAMGVADLQSNYNLVDPLEKTTNALDLEQLKGRLLSGNTSLRNALINQELSTLNTQFAKSNQVPRLSLSTGGTYNLNASKINAVNPFTMEEFGLTTGRTFNAYANVTIAYNIYTGGARQRAIENAMVQEQITALSVSDLQQDLLFQLESAYATYQNQIQLIRLNESLVENAQENLGIAEERFRGGLINSFDYRSLQIGYINANQALLSSIFNLKNTETTLMRLTGDLLRYE